MKEIRVTLVPSDLQPDPARYFPAEDHIHLVGTSGVLIIRKRVGYIEDRGRFRTPRYQDVVQYSPSGWLSVEVIE